MTDDMLFGGAFLPTGPGLMGKAVQVEREPRKSHPCRIKTRATSNCTKTRSTKKERLSRFPGLELFELRTICSRWPRRLRGPAAVPADAPDRPRPFPSVVPVLPCHRPSRPRQKRAGDSLAISLEDPRQNQRPPHRPVTCPSERESGALARDRRRGLFMSAASERASGARLGALEAQSEPIPDLACTLILAPRLHSPLLPDLHRPVPHAVHLVPEQLLVDVDRILVKTRPPFFSLPDGRVAALGKRRNAPS